MLRGSYQESQTKTGSRAHWYYELNRCQDGKRCRRFFREAQIEQLVVRLLDEICIPPSRMEDLRKQYIEYMHQDSQEDKRKALQKRIAQRKREREELVRMCTKGLIGEDEFITNRGQIQQEISELTRQLAILPSGKIKIDDFDQRAELMSRLPSTWLGCTKRDKQRLARTVFHKIVLDEDAQNVIAVLYNPPFDTIMLAASRLV